MCSGSRGRHVDYLRGHGAPRAGVLQSDVSPPRSFSVFVVAATKLKRKMVKQ